MSLAKMGESACVRQLFDASQLCRVDKASGMQPQCSRYAADIARIRAFHTGSTPRGCIEDERVGAGRASWGSPHPSQQPAPMQDVDAARRGYRLMQPTVSLLMHDATDTIRCRSAARDSDSECGNPTLGCWVLLAQAVPGVKVAGAFGHRPP